jgi:hypothetical protein
MSLQESQRNTVMKETGREEVKRVEEDKFEESSLI